MSAVKLQMIAPVQRVTLYVMTGFTKSLQRPRPSSGVPAHRYSGAFSSPPPRHPTSSCLPFRLHGWLLQVALPT